jgi:hypothetical protein
MYGQQGKPPVRVTSRIWTFSWSSMADTCNMYVGNVWGREFKLSPEREGVCFFILVWQAVELDRSFTFTLVS